MKQKIIFSSFLLVAVFLAGFYIFYRPSPKISLQNTKLVPEEIKSIEIGGTLVRVDLALTTETQELGLGDRNALQDNSGMLFVFDTLGNYPFWMKDMKFPIDIVWLIPGDTELEAKVIYIKKNAEPASYPEAFGPDQDAKYVLEVPAGFSEKNNLKIGDIVLFTD